jgi:predicted nucleic acid-binding protein
MRRLLVDTDVASYIFKWHPLAPRYVELMADNEVLISFVTLAEMRLGALK